MPLDTYGPADLSRWDLSERFPHPFPPPFASAWGDDGYGLWADLELPSSGGSDSVSQRLRWIERGTFLMGSPETEKERLNSEGPQHEVTIAEGFWLFDTACTQALWRAVMDDNPSYFKDPARPVEQVSWDDVQKFLARINALVSGLDLALPTEAQWEYACRAGTTTPFSFGETITPERVNYDGDYPYVGGKKGVNRQETVPVGSLPANPWGLYEMHGNIWEWCADHWHDTYEGAPTDGSAWIDAGADAGAGRVLRGGSWSNYARLVRSACRDAFDPGIRINFCGFRCARVPKGREPASGPEAREEKKRRGRSKPPEAAA